MLLNALQFSLSQLAFTIFETVELFLDQLAHTVNAKGLNQDFNASFVLVVAATKLVVHANNGIKVGQQVFFWQEGTDFFAQNRGAAKATTNENTVANVTRIVFNNVDADVMHRDGCAVLSRYCVYSDLELTRQEGKLRVKG